MKLGGGQTDAQKLQSYRGPNLNPAVQVGCSVEMDTPPEGKAEVQQSTIQDIWLRILNNIRQLRL